MYRFVAYTVVILILTIAFSQNANAVDMERSIESCLDIKTIATNLDTDWVLRQKLWYFPLMNKYNLYDRSTELAGRNPKDIHEDEMFYDSCVNFWFAGTKLFMAGFGDKKVSYSIDPKRGLQVFDMALEGEGATMKASCHTTLTDNKTFMVFACCRTDGPMLWGVPSLKKELSEETKKLIYDHAESLGFKREHFTRFQYDNCKPGFEAN